MECGDETINDDVIIDTNLPIYLDVTLGQSESNTVLLNDNVILKNLSEGGQLRILGEETMMGIKWAYLDIEDEV